MLILILVALWLVVLAPAFVRRRLERRSTVSIDSFHRSLHLLERTGPKLVSPAFRLETVNSVNGVTPGQSGLPSVSSMPGRPNLVLLQPVDDDGSGADGGPAADEVADASGRHYLRVHRLSADTGNFAGGHAPSLAAQNGEYRAELARRRRRDILLGLAGTVTITALLGIVDALHPLWVISVLGGIALAVYVGLAAYVQSVRNGRSHPRARSAGTGRPVSAFRAGSAGAEAAAGAGVGRRARRSSVAGRGAPAVADDRWDPQLDGVRGVDSAEPGLAGRDAHWAATAGFPGAWDDDYQADFGDDGYYYEEYEEPRRAVGGG